MHTDNSFFDRLNEEYDSFHVGDLVTNRFSYADFRQALAQFDAEYLHEEELGNSVEGRRIYAYTLGSGPIKVLMWSQMHGNESTATRAILDMFNVFSGAGSFTDQIEHLKSTLTVKVIPMLNPDGTERFQRRNAQGIDLNRDARALQAPESRILKKAYDEFQPDFAFNLHDQRRMYNVQGSANKANISFLAPAYNVAEEINDSRARGMKLIAYLNTKLQSIIPGAVSKYDDAYSYRAFGDNVQSWGASTILVEAGWTENDMEKEAIRKLNLLILMAGLESISTSGYETCSIEDYDNIPMNDEKMVDLLITCANWKVNGFNTVTDIAVNQTEISIPGTRQYYSKGTIEDMGDLSPFYGFINIDECDLTIQKGKVHSQSFDFLEEVENLDFEKLLQEGILFVPCAELPAQEYTDFPMNIVSSGNATQYRHIDFESQANFVLTNTENEIKYLVLNGFLVDPMNIDAQAHGLVIR